MSKTTAPGLSSKTLVAVDGEATTQTILEAAHQAASIFFLLAHHDFVARLRRFGRPCAPTDVSRHCVRSSLV